MVALLRFLYVLINRQVNDIYVLFITAFWTKRNVKLKSLFTWYIKDREYTMLTVSKVTRARVCITRASNEICFLFFLKVEYDGRWLFTFWDNRKNKISCSFFLYTIIKVHYHLNAQQPIEIKVKLIDIQLLKRR